LLEAVEKLENLLKDLRGAQQLSSTQRREIFRTLHTVKGTAQTFGFAASSKLAHKLENLLSSDETLNNLLPEGIELLIKSLTEKDFELSEKFIEKTRVAVPNEAEILNNAGDNWHELPNEIFSQLSKQEKNALQSAVRHGRNLFGLEIGFESANFADELISFREILCESGEIIATFPSAKFNADDKIGFRFLLASFAKSAEIEKLGADVFFQSSQNDFSSDIKSVLAHVVEHGKTIAKNLEKEIEIETHADDANLSPEKLKLIFDILLHLVRNAVDHAILSRGTIEICVTKDRNGVRFIVADNGGGIDLKKIKAKAIEKNLISADEILTDRDTINLIFLPEFSTTSKVTEISGRGIGLDAVKYAVENASGKINVETQTGKGTTFDIFLPH